jgi:hypothetical protein
MLEESFGAIGQRQDHDGSAAHQDQVIAFSYINNPG